VEEREMRTDTVGSLCGDKEKRWTILWLRWKWFRLKMLVFSRKGWGLGVLLIMPDWLGLV